MRRTLWAWLGLVVLPGVAQATTCDVIADIDMDCGINRQKAPIGITTINSDVLANYTGCGTGTSQTGYERVIEFTCSDDVIVDLTMDNTNCDVNLFVLDDTCDGINQCLAKNTEPYFFYGYDHEASSFLCEYGRSYFIVLELYASEVPGFGLPPASGGNCPLKATAQGDYYGSEARVTAKCSEICDDGVDNDEDNLVDCNDVDDCAQEVVCGGPGPQEDCDNGVDDDDDLLADCLDPDCSGEAVCCDDDGDGFLDMAGDCGGDDCDDDPITGPAFNPAQDEGVADGVDQDCDGFEDCYEDLDEDDFGSDVVVASADLTCTAAGVADNDDDCDDDDEFAYPNAPETAADGIDQDCDLADDCFVDMDEDGVGAGSGSGNDMDCTDDFEAVISGDCDDNDPGRFPDNPEIVADGIDQDCDTHDRCYRDLDQDGWGSGEVTGQGLNCVNLAAMLSDQPGDCAPNDPDRNPGETDVLANGIDEDCTGNDLCYTDADGDHYGRTAPIEGTGLDCSTSPGAADNPDDCDDDPITGPNVNPGATEIPYNGIDDDCVDGDEGDRDGDGFAGGVDGDDCDDDDPDINPLADEIVANGIDEDCTGGDRCWRDADGDGYGTSLATVDGDDLDCDDAGESPLLGDCDDDPITGPDVNPDGVDIPYNGIDEDCLDGDWDDLDDDGAPGGPNGTDCADLIATIRPNRPEIANGIDDDCDGRVDEGTDAYDDDGDGYTEDGGDCDDTDDLVHPGAPERVNSYDDDCDGVDDEGTAARDDDGDGFSELQGDCDDGDDTVFPGAPELPSATIDSNCDGTVGQRDTDGDGYSVLGGDCDDLAADRYPGAPEEADGEDDDCDGRIDEGTLNYDDDGDGFTEAQGDCDDRTPLRSPDATENTRNGIDDDCDGQVDENGPFTDDDGDGFTEDGGDCDDADRQVNPAANERANDIDDDCDGVVDDGALDQDADGYTVAQGDCDDLDGWSHPEGREVCDGADNDCDGEVDEDACDTRVVAPPEDTGGCAQVPSAPALWLAALAALGWRRRRTAA